MTAIDGNILEGVSATTLWTLHNRGTEAKRSDGVIRDPWAVTLFDAISYDYRKFGKPNQSHALRARAFDAAAQRLPDVAPQGVGGGARRGSADQLLAAGPCRVAERIDLVLSGFAAGDGVAWTTAARAMTGSSQLAQSALDRSWMDRVDDAGGVFITAEGLLMYLEPDDALGPDPRLCGPLPRRADDVRLDPALVKPAHAEGAEAVRPLHRSADAVRADRR